MEGLARIARHDRWSAIRQRNQKMWVNLNAGLSTLRGYGIKAKFYCDSTGVIGEFYS